MNTLQSLLNSSSLLKNVIVTTRNYARDNNMKYAYSNWYGDMVYAVYTQELPYQQYIIVFDIETLKPILN